MATAGVQNQPEHKLKEQKLGFRRRQRDEAGRFVTFRQRPREELRSGRTLPHPNPLPPPRFSFLLIFPLRLLRYSLLISFIGLLSIHSLLAV
ncbi:hypothetical protein L6452_17085 [Arctium lappa]|uniref:Uncharacterized protein n=1 Tax=Arctium lappa TaxID=4217 RepID=A0ACB9C2M9_ARCLA|nr:hypothetical protein L6452_17085 [Arctium lappa]